MDIKEKTVLEDASIAHLLRGAPKAKKLPYGPIQRTTRIQGILGTFNDQ
jgi:hypothetical protein